MLKKILVVEDEQILMRALNVELLSQGFEVLSAKDGETGLGLYIAKAFIEARKGAVWFDSAENKGTTFYIKLPL